MNNGDDRVKEWNVCQAAGVPEHDKQWQPPRLTVWEVVRDTSMSAPVTKTGSGADSLGMRDVNV
jgi:carboxylesterase type B